MDDWKGEHLIRIKPRCEMTEAEKRATSSQIISRMQAKKNRQAGIKTAAYGNHRAFVRNAMGWSKTPIQPPHGFEE